MNYIWIQSPDIAKVRVKNRVSKGGHGIPDETIEKRYYKSLDNLKKVIPICDEVNIFDNTYEFIQIAYYRLGVLIWESYGSTKWFEGLNIPD